MAQDLILVQLLPVRGDWFAVLFEGKDWFLERVIAWALVERRDDGCRWVTGVGEGGSPITDAVDVQPANVFFVAGEDFAPGGHERWRELFNTPPPPRTRVKCVSESMRRSRSDDPPPGAGYAANLRAALREHSPGFRQGPDPDGGVS